MNTGEREEEEANPDQQENSKNERVNERVSEMIGPHEMEKKKNGNMHHVGRGVDGSKE